MHKSSPTSSLRSAGFSFVELLVAFAVLILALSIFSNAVAGLGKQRVVSRENALAAWAASNVLESMRREDFAEVFALYNSDSGDDPVVSAPGNRFLVAGLDSLPGAPAGLHGEVIFPTFEDPLDGLQLREDLVDPRFGTPRDLSGDSIIDGNGHNDDYFALPVLIRIQWSGSTGRRQYELASLLCHFEKADL